MNNIIILFVIATFCLVNEVAAEKIDAAALRESLGKELKIMTNPNAFFGNGGNVRSLGVSDDQELKKFGVFCETKPFAGFLIDLDVGKFALDVPWAPENKLQHSAKWIEVPDVKTRVILPDLEAEKIIKAMAKHGISSHKTTTIIRNAEEQVISVEKKLHFTIENEDIEKVLEVAQLYFNDQNSKCFEFSRLTNVRE